MAPVHSHQVTGAGPASTFNSTSIQVAHTQLLRVASVHAGVAPTKPSRSSYRGVAKIIRRLVAEAAPLVSRCTGLLRLGRHKPRRALHKTTPCRQINGGIVAHASQAEYSNSIQAGQISE